MFNIVQYFGRLASWCVVQQQVQRTGNVCRKNAPSSSRKVQRTATKTYFGALHLLNPPGVNGYKHFAALPLFLPFEGNNMVSGRKFHSMP